MTLLAAPADLDLVRADCLKVRLPFRDSFFWQRTALRGGALRLLLAIDSRRTLFTICRFLRMAGLVLTFFADFLQILTDFLFLGTADFFSYRYSASCLTT